MPFKSYKRSTNKQGPILNHSSQGAEEQAHRIAETATAAQNMNAATQKVAENANQASVLSAKARHNAQKGALVIKEAGDSMVNLNEQAHILKTDMDELNTHAKAITQIMAVISDIADQTNLLALNAAIEAARAGETGRGFAVVADEVRKLAEKTMTSTADVSRTIQQIQESASKNIQQVERTGEIIEQVSITTKGISEVLTEIVQLVEDNTDQIQAIARASEEQSANSDKVNQAMAGVHTISHTTSQAMQQAAQAITTLTQQSQALTRMIHEMQQH